MALSKEQQQQVILGVMLVVGFFYAYFNYGIKPINTKIQETRQELSKEKNRLETMKRTATRLPALQKEYNALEEEVGKAERKLPKEKNMEDVLRIVTEQAIQQKLAVASFSPQRESARNYFIEIPIQINLSGTVHSIGHFLATMGQQERIFSARNLSLSYSLNPERGHTVTGRFTLLAYMFKG